MSDKKKHTPGPWVAGVDLFRPPKVFVHAPDSYAVCRVMTAHYHAETAKANAHLIAAAPSLLEACKDLVDRFERKATSKASLSCSYSEAKAAIAKAEGR